MELNRSNFIICKQQIIKIFANLDLEKFLTKDPLNKILANGQINQKSISTEFNKPDKMIERWFMSCISQEVLRHISGFTIVREVWTGLDISFCLNLNQESSIVTRAV